jgi:SUR7/PalI family
LTQFTVNNTGLDPIPGTNLDNDVLNQALNQAKAATNVKDFYTIYLWNYCAWDGSDKYSFCSKKEAYFSFDPVEAWGLEQTGIQNVFPKELQDGLKAYKAVSRWMFIAYVVALVATILELLVGISAIFSRWGSFCTTFVSSVSSRPGLLHPYGILMNLLKVSSFFILAASITATVMFSTLLGSFNEVFKSYGIKATLGAEMMRITWLAVAFSFGAGIFWLLSVCCCAGRSPYGGKKDSKRVKVEKTPYTYERVGSPYLGPQGGAPQSGGAQGQQIPMHNLGSNAKGSPYEPFRPSHV